MFDSTIASTSDLGKASSGDVEISEKLPRGKNDWRTDLVAQSRIAPNVLVSQQSCSLRENFGTLLKLRQSAKMKSEINRINGLMAVLQHLAALKLTKRVKKFHAVSLQLRMHLNCTLGMIRNMSREPAGGMAGKGFSKRFFTPSMDCVYT